MVRSNVIESLESRRLMTISGLDPVGSLPGLSVETTPFAVYGDVMRLNGTSAADDVTLDLRSDGRGYAATINGTSKRSCRERIRHCLLDTR